VRLRHCPAPEVKEDMCRPRSNGIAAVSNPSIELWFNVHFRSQTVHRQTGGLSLLRTHLRGYDKTIDNPWTCSTSSATPKQRERSMDAKE